MVGKLPPVNKRRIFDRTQQKCHPQTSQQSIIEAEIHLIELEDVGAVPHPIALIAADVLGHAADDLAPGEDDVPGVDLVELHEAAAGVPLGEAEAEVAGEVEAKPQRTQGPALYRLPLALHHSAAEPHRSKREGHTNKINKRGGRKRQSSGLILNYIWATEGGLTPGGRRGVRGERVGEELLRVACVRRRRILLIVRPDVGD